MASFEEHIKFENLDNCGGTLIAKKSDRLAFRSGLLELSNFNQGNAIVALSKAGSGLGAVGSFAIMSFPTREQWHEFVHTSVPVGALTTSYFKKQ